ncbi:solute carrier family 2, facilitated glucose transporter member 11-like isoform X2 [Anolis carolinensis]|uniref:solute carrier family 2, facilitated glucose transporter member 11-like isoform X2 n=1 Tax=Anolis carolinensis TaxID=28377 RepID=UPI002F2B6216
MATFLSDLVQYRGFFQMVLILGIGGSFPYGFHISVINYPSMHIKRFLNATWSSRHGRPLSPEAVQLLWSSIVSAYGLGGLLGSAACGFLTARFRKKKCQAAANGVMVGAALCVGLSESAASFEMILLARFLFGVGIGISFSIHPQYVGEISPKRLRGFANATVAIFLTLGKVAGQVAGLREVLGGASLWPLLLALTGLSALAQSAALPCFPDSPSYLLLQKGNEEAFLQAIRRLWGPGDHGAEIEDLRREQVQWCPSSSPLPPPKGLRVRELLASRSLRWQLYVTFALMTTLQLCGINAIYFYSFEVFRTAQFEEETIPYVALGVGVCECLSSVLCSSLIERFGRRRLLWGGYAAMVLVLALLTATLTLQHRFLWMHYVSVVLIFLFVIFYGIGPSGATIAVMVEMFTQAFRPSAFVLVGILNWAGLFLLGMAFPFIVAWLGPFCFLLFVAVLSASAAFVFLFLPETKGKSIVEITAEFNKLNYRRKKDLFKEEANHHYPKEGIFCTRL